MKTHKAAADSHLGDQFTLDQRVDMLRYAAEKAIAAGASSKSLREVVTQALRSTNGNGTDAELQDAIGNTQAAGSGAWPAPLDLGALLTTPAPTPQYIVEDCMPAGYATLLSGHGGSGKSSIALHLAACIATGRQWWGRHCATRRVLYLSCEDRVDVLHWRLARIARYEKLAAADLAGLHVLDLVGHEVVLFRPYNGEGNVTPAFMALKLAIEQTRAQVVFIDGISDVYAANEILRAEVKAFVNYLLGLVGSEGAINLLGHVDKKSAGVETQEGYSGTTGWHNAVRARMYLYPQKTDGQLQPTQEPSRMILDLQKNQFGKRDGKRLVFQWQQDSGMFVADITSTPTTDYESEQAGILSALAAVLASGNYCPAATTGPRSSLNVLKAAKGFPQSIQGATGKRRFWAHIETLRQMGEIVEGSIRRANRHVTAVLLTKSYENSHAPDASNADSGIRRSNGAGATAPNAPNGAGVIGGVRARTGLTPEEEKAADEQFYRTKP